MKTRFIFGYLSLLILYLYSNEALGQILGNEATHLLQTGDNMFKTGNVRDALVQYDRVIATDPDNAQAYIRRAKLYQAIGQPKEAINDYNRAIAINPYVEAFYDNRAKLKILASDYKGAINDISQAILLNPSNDTLREHRVDYYINVQEFDQALHELDTLLQHGYDQYNSLLKKAYIAYEAKDLNAAETFVQAALSTQTYDAPNAHDLLGLIYTKSQQFDKAIDAYNLAIKQKPDFAIAYYNRGLTYRLIHNEKKAIKDLDKAVSLAKNNPNIYFSRALVRKEMGDLEGAIADYSQTISLEKNHTDALINRSLTKKYLGDLKGALKDIDQALKQKNDPLAWNLRGNINLLFGEYRQAIDDYNQAISYKTDYAEAFYNRGLAQIMVYAPAQGCADLEQAYSLGYKNAKDKIRFFCK